MRSTYAPRRCNGERMRTILLWLCLTATVLAASTTTTTLPVGPLANPAGWTDADIQTMYKALAGMAPQSDLAAVFRWMTQLVCADRATQKAVMAAALQAVQQQVKQRAADQANAVSAPD